MCSCHLFLIASASVISISVLYCAHLSMKCSFSISNFPEEISSVSISFYCFPLFFCIDRCSYLSFLFSGTLNSARYVFPLLLCLSLLFFSQLLVRPPQTTTLPSCISLSLGWTTRNFYPALS